MTTTVQPNKTKLKAVRDVITSWIQVPTLKEFIENSGGTAIVELVANNRWIRQLVFRIFEKRTKQFYMEREDIPLAVKYQQYYMARAVLDAIARHIDNVQDKEWAKQALTQRVAPALMKAAVRQADRYEQHKQEYGEHPPGFLVISPTKACNLNCKGCYANASGSSNEKLDFETFNKILEEKKELWGSWFTVISGGEPFMYKSDGKDLLDVVERHPDNFFLVYTNGTLIDEKTARRMAELGNITPAISVEGYEEETDERRGKGTYKKILQAFENLQNNGVPYGVSLTAFNHNAHMLNQDFFDTYVYELGVYYVWIFQYMPIGREQSLDLLVTPEQRLRMYRDTEYAVKEKRMFIADFWNSGAVSSGCISAGKPGGYMYIDWNGEVTPCVFNPYSPANIYDVYDNGGDLNDVVQNPFFKEIRRWQREYGTDTPPEETGNWMTPCPIKDHYDYMYEQLTTYKPKPIDPSGEEALQDENYREGLIDYGKKVEEITAPIWEKEVIEPERERKKGNNGSEG
jgi:MoaA/NifB/PqqE/SkfB family radical SAM enzyme